MNKKRFGFTLAEVLITLGIIGVVAAMTIPSLMANNAKQQYVTGLKKAYTTTNQALKQMSTDYGCIDDLKCTGLFASTVSIGTLGNEIVKYFKVTKNCEATNNKDCWGIMNHKYDGSGTTFNFNTTYSYYKFVTLDGMSFAILSNANNCATNHSSGSTGNLEQVCGFLYIDVNGIKKPNNAGRDIFLFKISNGKGSLLYPRGGKDDNASQWKTTSIQRCDASIADKTGEYCAGRIMEEGWQMNY